jgi:hypothetical protein
VTSPRRDLRGAHKQAPWQGLASTISLCFVGAISSKPFHAKHLRLSPPKLKPGNGMRLKDKIAVVTGAAEGIGLACAERFFG